MRLDGGWMFFLHFIKERKNTCHSTNLGYVKNWARENMGRAVWYRLTKERSEIGFDGTKCADGIHGVGQRGTGGRAKATWGRWVSYMFGAQCPRVLMQGRIHPNLHEYNYMLAPEIQAWKTQFLSVSSCMLCTFVWGKGLELGEN